MSSGPAHPSTLGPTSLDDVHVDVTTRLGAPAKLTPTGFSGLDLLLGGGLRAGMLVGLLGAPGTGKTSLSLAMAYVAARSQAGVAFATRALDETEIFARLAARALRRSYPASEVTYGDIWSGAAFRGDAVRRAISDAVGTVVQKVGPHLHLARLHPRESVAEFAARSSPLWARHERVLFFVDDLEGLVASQGSLDAELVSVAYGLRELADQGCTVVFTALPRTLELVAPASTALLEVSVGAADGAAKVPIELRLVKNRLGPVGSVALEALFGALEFTEAGATASRPA